MEQLGRPRPAILRALGKLDPPLAIEVQNLIYHRDKIFKHDSWAATALYTSTSGAQIVCKFNRVQPILGCSMRWLGRRLARRESSHLLKLAEVSCVPNECGPVLVDGRAQANAVAHVYVPGSPLRSVDRVSETFCDELVELLRSIHDRDMAYIDLHKRENILMGDDGKPHLIDFQVSIAIPSRLVRRFWPLGFLLRQLQAADRYHLRKHLACIDPSRHDEPSNSERPWWIRLHRLVAEPLRTVRRRLLVLLGVRRGKGRVETEHFAEDSFLWERKAAS